MRNCPNCGFESAPDARLCSNCGYEYTDSLGRTLDWDQHYQHEIDPIKEKLIEKYQILRFLGRGGFSKVFLIKDKDLDRLCALKILSRELTVDKEMVERFKREARLYASLEHPNIVSVYDFGFYNHVAYIIMKFIDGVSLKEYIRQHSPLPQEEIVSISRDLASILSYMHGRGIIHRDIKPDNVMVQRGDRRIVLTDFGLAKNLETTSMTSSSRMMGSPHYFSPEQARGEPADVRSDIYSLGITLYEMATGEVPYKGDTPYKVILQHLNEQAPLPPIKRRDIHPQLVHVITKASQKEVRKRYQTVDLLKRDLDQIPASVPAGATITHTKVIKTEAIPRMRKGFPIKTGALIGGGVLAVLFAGWLIITSSKPEQAPSPADAQKTQAGQTLPENKPQATEKPKTEASNVPGTVPKTPQLVARDKPQEQSAAKSATEKAASGTADQSSSVAKNPQLEAQKKPLAKSEGKTSTEKAGAVKVSQTAPIQKPEEEKKTPPKPLSTASQDSKLPIEKSQVQKSEPPPTPAASQPERQPEAKPQTQKPESTKSEVDKQVPATIVSPPKSENVRTITIVKMIDLPAALTQEYNARLGQIVLGAAPENVQFSGIVTLMLGIDASGHLLLQSMSDRELMVEPGSGRQEIFRILTKGIQEIKLASPLDRQGNPVKVDGWRARFRIGRSGKQIILSMIKGM